MPSWSDIFSTPAEASTLSAKQRHELNFQRELQKLHDPLAAAKAKAAADEVTRNEQREQAQRQAEFEKQQAQRPFTERHPGWAAALPWGTAAVSALAPMLWNKAKGASLRNFTQDWANQGKAASEELSKEDPDKWKALLNTNKLKDYETQWPERQKQFAKGSGFQYPIFAGAVSGEASLLPLEIDYLQQDKNSPGRPKPEDWEAAVPRALLAGATGVGLSKHMSNFGYGKPPMPYTGGQGIINTFEKRFPEFGENPTPELSGGSPIPPEPPKVGMNPEGELSVPNRTPQLSASDVHFGKSPFPSAPPQPAQIPYKGPRVGNVGNSPTTQADIARVLKTLSGIGK